MRSYNDEHWAIEISGQKKKQLEILYNAMPQDTQGANHHIFVKTDMVCYKRLLYMVGFLRPPTSTSEWTTFSMGYCNSEIQDGVQDGRHKLIKNNFALLSPIVIIFSCAIHRFHSF